jgi:hypothetical protein
LVLAVSGILGFRVGLIGFPTWQISVETAQVVAGLVEYPEGNPFYVYHTKLWSSLIQICALLLKAGVSEITLSLAVSGLLGMVSFQALAMVVYAIGRDAVIAIGAAFVFFVSGVTDHGVVYPVMLLGTHHTYGAIGLSLFVLVVALIGAGCHRSGALLLGIAPSVHPSLGIWVGTTVALALAWHGKAARDEFRPALKYFLAGCAFTVLSLIVQLAFVYDVPAGDAAAVSRTYSTFVTTWDGHRRAEVDMSGYGAVFNRIALAVGLIWIIGFARDLRPSAVFFLRVVVVSAALSKAFILLTWLPPDRLPMILSILMPARLLNFNVLVIGPLLLGLLGAYGGRIAAARILTFILLAGVMLAPSSRLWQWTAEKQWQLDGLRIDPALLYQAIALALLCLALWQSNRRPSAGDVPTAPPRTTAAMLPVRLASVGVLAIAFGLVWRVESSPSVFRDRTNDSFYFAVAADRRGLTVTAGTFQLVQLYTRRPVLIDSGALDTMAYAPESGPALAQILRDVYGIDFFNPPPAVRSSSAVSHDISKQVWAHYTTDQWRALRRTYNVSQVVTREDYELDLPIAERRHGLRLYRIPD